MVEISILNWQVLDMSILNWQMVEISIFLLTSEKLVVRHLTSYNWGY